MIEREMSTFPLCISMSSHSYRPELECSSVVEEGRLIERADCFWMRYQSPLPAIHCALIRLWDSDLSFKRPAKIQMKVH